MRGMEYMEQTGELAGLPSRLVAALKRRGVETRAQVAVWHRAEAAGSATTRGIGPRSLQIIAAWLGESDEEPTA